MGTRVLPQYRGGSLVNLMASVLEACGAARRHPGLELLASRELSDARNVVLVILDGVGDNYLMRQGAGGELARRRRGALTSVFPSTTASAITTSYTGCTPLEHGITGWFTYFGAAGYVAAPLPFRIRGNMQPLRETGFRPAQAFTAKPIFQQMSSRAIVVSPVDIIESDYNLHHCAAAERRPFDSLERLVEQVEAAVKSGPERKFVYAYWPAYDAISHRYGALSAEAAREFQRIDEAFADLLKRLSGTDSAVIATADHGFIDVPDERCLELPASLASMLRFPLCGERRVAYCHVHDAEAFVHRAQDWLGERGEAKPSGSLVDEGWFGAGEPHPRFAERIGDVVLVMDGDFTVKDWTPGEAHHLHIGNHGGATADEMKIPLILENA
jgi:hypothetical protein